MTTDIPSTTTLTKAPMPSPLLLERIAELGLELPSVPRPIANFVPYRIVGDFAFLSGQICEWNGTVTHSGRVGVDIDLAEARSAARICGLNLIAALANALEGSSRRVSHCVRLRHHVL